MENALLNTENHRWIIEQVEKTTEDKAKMDIEVDEMEIKMDDMEIKMDDMEIKMDEEINNKTLNQLVIL